MAKPNTFGRFFGFKQSYFGSDASGHDVKAFGTTTGKYMFWDAVANTFKLVGAMTQTGNQTVTGNQSVTGTLTVAGQFVKGERTVVQFPNFAAADVAKTFFVAPAACKVIQADECHVTKAGQAGVLTVEKLTSGQAPGAGAVVLAAGGLDLAANNGVPTTCAALTTAAATLAAGNVLALKLQSGAATSLAGASLSVTIEWV